MGGFFVRWWAWLAGAARRASDARARQQAPAPRYFPPRPPQKADAAKGGRIPMTGGWAAQGFEFEPTVRVGRTGPQTTQAPGGETQGEDSQAQGARSSEENQATRGSASATRAQAQKKDEQKSRQALQERALAWAEKRWGRLLDTLRFEPSSLASRWGAAQEEGLTEPERQLAPQNAKKFVDGLLIARRWEVLDALWSQIERAAFRSHLQSKAPSLAKWAAGQIEESDLLPTKNPDLIDWARQKGAFEPQKLRASHVADAVAAGDSRRAREAIDDSGEGALSPPDAAEILGAMARKKELGGMAGLGADELGALWDALGGAQGQGLESLAGLPPAELAWALAKLLDAMAETEAAEQAVLEQAAKINSKRARELIARVIATQAASQERVGLLRNTLDRAPALMGVTRAQAMDAKSPAVVARVGAMRARAEREGGVSLSEAAALSGSKGAAAALESMGAKAAEPQALKELVKSASKDVRRQVVRSQLAEEQAKAWRQTLTEWKSGVLPATTVSGLEARAREKFEENQRQKAKGPRA